MHLNFKSFSDSISLASKSAEIVVFERSRSNFSLCSDVVTSGIQSGNTTAKRGKME